MPLAWNENNLPSFAICRHLNIATFVDLEQFYISRFVTRPPPTTLSNFPFSTLRVAVGVSPYVANDILRGCPLLEFLEIVGYPRFLQNTRLIDFSTPTVSYHNDMQPLRYLKRAVSNEWLAPDCIRSGLSHLEDDLKVFLDKFPVIFLDCKLSFRQFAACVSCGFKKFSFVEFDVDGQTANLDLNIPDEVIVESFSVTLIDHPDQSFWNFLGHFWVQRIIISNSSFQNAIPPEEEFEDYCKELVNLKDHFL
jgi:hypothetical protein